MSICLDQELVIQRNKIVYHYLLERFNQIHKEIIENVPKLLEI